jgi:hypothetical protein
MTTAEPHGVAMTGVGGLARTTGRRHFLLQYCKDCQWL